MAYLLNGTTLPTPKEFSRDLVETSAVVTTLNGATKKDITNRKERYTLEFTMLTQTQINTIMSIYNTQTTVTFEVTETNLTISSTTCHMEMPSRSYATRGDEYREDITLILTEVQ